MATYFPFEEYKYRSHPDSIYLQNASNILFLGEKREDRTGTGAISFFSPPEMRFDLTQGFPLLTTKKLHIPSIVHELIWFLKGDTNIKYLLDNNVNIWNADAYRWYVSKNGGITDPSIFNYYVWEQRMKTDNNFANSHGDLGPIYGKQWRAWETNEFENHWAVEMGDPKVIDQIKQLIKSIKNNPTSRRHIVSAWNVAEVDEMALPPCHIFFQAYVSNDGGLSLKMYQRSADWFLGVPFNIASYALLTHMIAQVTGLYAKEFIHTIGDGHIYTNHVDQINEQLTREPKTLPTLWLNPEIKNIDDFTADDIRFDGYDPFPLIKGSVSVG